MKNLLILPKTVIGCSILIFSLQAKAIHCSSTQLSVCTSSDLSSLPVNTCVQNSDLKNYFSGHPNVTVGDCSNFSMKKIATYPCNAGLRYIESAGSPNSSNTNYFNFSIADYDGTETYNFTKSTLNASHSSLYATAANSSGSKILKGNSELQFHFGSELYGAEYFVDLCILNKNINPERFELNISGKIFFPNSVFSASNYTNSSSLYNSVELKCTDANATQTTKTLLGDSIFQTAEKKYSRTFNGSNSCVVRHYFREGAANKTRENQFKKITFQTDISLAPTDETLLNPIPVKFCRIIKDKGHKCTQWISSSAESFLIDLESSNFFNTGDIYTGVCPNPCRPL